MNSHLHHPFDFFLLLLRSLPLDEIFVFLNSKSIRTALNRAQDLLLSQKNYFTVFALHYEDKFSNEQEQISGLNPSCLYPFQLLEDLILLLQLLPDLFGFRHQLEPVLSLQEMPQVGLFKGDQISIQVTLNLRIWSLSFFAHLPPSVLLFLPSILDLTGKSNQFLYKFYQKCRHI